MINEPWVQENEKILAEFIEETQGDHGEITVAIKATLVQFITNVRLRLNQDCFADSNDEKWIEGAHIIKIQMDELNHIVSDLMDYYEIIMENSNENA